jgi:ribosome-associated heat shock protein Hsp15
MERVRIDKWLWAARFFKTRGLAARACELGRVQSNGIVAKPAREVHLGDLLKVKTEAGEFEINVLGVSDIRGPAVVAQTLYSETDDSKVRRQKAAEERKMVAQFELLPESRPSKRDRRDLERFRGRL